MGCFFFERFWFGSTNKSWIINSSKLSVFALFKLGKSLLLSSFNLSSFTSLHFYLFYKYATFASIVAQFLISLSLFWHLFHFEFTMKERQSVTVHALKAGPCALWVKTSALKLLVQIGQSLFFIFGLIKTCSKPHPKSKDWILLL